MRSLRVKNWAQFQHYKKRCPPWIKLHRELVNDYAFTTLRDATKAHLILIWILAAGSDGVVPADERFLALRIGATERVDVDAMTAAGFLELQDDGEPAPAPAAATPKARRPRPQLNGAFCDFYAAYPKKKNRADAERAWLRLSPDEALQARILAAVEQQKDTPDWRKDGGKFIPYPASWLNGRRWEDEVKVAPQHRPGYVPI